MASTATGTREYLISRALDFLSAHGIKANVTHVIDVKPIGKPRMTRSDKWKKRPATDRYWAFKDEFMLKANLSGLKLGKILHVVFILEMPDSWSEKKKIENDGKMHLAKPDRDNMLKSIQDVFGHDDSSVAHGITSKIWGYKSGIVFYEHITN